MFISLNLGGRSLLSYYVVKRLWGGTYWKCQRYADDPLHKDSCLCLIAVKEFLHRECVSTSQEKKDTYNDPPLLLWKLEFVYFFFCLLSKFSGKFEFKWNWWGFEALKKKDTCIGSPNPLLYVRGMLLFTGYKSILDKSS